MKDPFDKVKLAEAEAELLDLFRPHTHPLDLDAMRHERLWPMLVMIYCGLLQLSRRRRTARRAR
jgi:hypothetical protein